MIRLNRNSESYARAAGKVASLCPEFRRLGGGAYRVQGSSGDTYFVREVLPGLFYCECRFRRKPLVCYHCVAVDLERRATLERFHNEVREHELGIMIRDLTTKERIGMQVEAAWLTPQLETHCAGCARCIAGAYAFCHPTRSKRSRPRSLPERIGATLSISSK